MIIISSNMIIIREYLNLPYLRFSYIEIERERDRLETTFLMSMTPKGY